MSGGRGGSACHGDWNQAARLPLEQQQFHGKQYGGDWRRKRRGHTRRCSGNQQGLALRTAQVEELRDQRTDGAARHDDWTLGSKWSTRADCNRSRNRLKNGNLGFILGAPEQDRLNRL